MNSVQAWSNIETGINQATLTAHAIAQEHGFWDARETSPKELALALALVHSEASECIEALRKTNIDWDDVQEELADIVIRVFDIAGAINSQIGYVVSSKMKRNMERSRLHGKTF